VHTLQHLNDLGDEVSIDQVQHFAAKHGLAASVDPLSKKGKLALFGNMLSASKPLKALESEGKNVLDIDHLREMARPAQIAGGQSGSRKQKLKIGGSEIWAAYSKWCDKGPLAASSSTHPLQVTLQDIADQDDIREFGKHVVAQLDKLTNWKPPSLDRTRELISAQVSNDLGDTPRSNDFAEMTRRLRLKNTLWQDKQISQFPGLDSQVRNSQYRVYVRESYRALEREKQRTFIATLPLIDRVGLVVGLLLTWYKNGKTWYKNGKELGLG